MPHGRRTQPRRPDDLSASISRSVTNESVSSQRIFDGHQHRIAVLLELRGADAVDESQLGRRCRECERDAFDRGVMEHHGRGFAIAQLLARPAQQVEGTDAGGSR